ncbi:MAG: glycosyltransferase family 4 protein [Candidatus Omnitrophica bacterium]|nr:glycosyltransferase family 4 protein [Candidatus Omnitrophota bacterium]
MKDLVTGTKSKYKVLHLLEWWDLGGGLETVTKEIVCGLNKDKCDVEVWCLHRGGPMAEEIRQKGIPVRILNISTYHNPFNILKLAQLFKLAKPDIIHSHVYFASTIGRLAAKIAGIKICVNHVHSSYWHYSQLNLIIERILSFFTYKIICVSQSVQEFVIDHERIDPAKAVVIYNGISRRNIQTVPRVGNDFVITVVASLLANKGHGVLLEAISSLKDKHPHIKCWVVGEGEMEAQLKEHAKELGIEKHTTFLGVRRDIPEILSASHLFVLPSLLREGLPVSILEAMAYGVAVVASSVGGIPEVIEDGKNGCLVPPHDPQRLADCIDGLICNPERCHHLALAGKQTFEERFEAKIMVNKIEDLYEESMEA